MPYVEVPPALGGPIAWLLYRVGRGRHRLLPRPPRWHGPHHAGVAQHRLGLVPRPLHDGTPHHAGISTASAPRLAGVFPTRTCPSTSRRVAPPHAGVSTTEMNRTTTDFTKARATPRATPRTSRHASRVNTGVWYDTSRTTTDCTMTRATPRATPRRPTRARATTRVAIPLPRQGVHHGYALHRESHHHGLHDGTGQTASQANTGLWYETSRTITDCKGIKGTAALQHCGTTALWAQKLQRRLRH